MAITRYYYSKLAIDNCFFGDAEGGELFPCPPLNLLISLQLLVLSIAIVTVTVCACVKACSNLSNALNANNFRVF